MLSRTIQRVPKQIAALVIYLYKVLGNHYQDIRDIYMGEAYLEGQKLAVTEVTTSPYTILDTDYHVFVDTDSGAVTLNLPIGIHGRGLRIINVGGSGNNITLVPNGTEKINGFNANETLYDAEKFILAFSDTKGWW